MKIGDIDMDKTITLSLKDFVEVSTDVSAEICAHLGNPTLGMFACMMFAEITRRLWDDELTIDGKEEE